MKSKFFTTILALIAAISINLLAQPYMIKNINTNFNSSGKELQSTNMCGIQYNGTWYFSADSETFMYETQKFWKTTGTEASTVKIHDANMISSNFHIYNGNLYYSAYYSNKYSLYKSNGTTAGTTALKGITGQIGSRSYVNSGNKFFFTVVYFKINNVTGTYYADCNIWKSDGTSKGTAQVKEINRNGDDGIYSKLCDVNGTVFFFANDGKNGSELWKTDGSSTGTVLVSNINKTSGVGSYVESPKYPGTDAYYTFAYMFLNVNGVYYFTANGGTNGSQVWKSDGTDAGTVEVTNSSSIAANCHPYNYLLWNGYLYFCAKDASGWQWWRFVPGNEANTIEKITNINPAGTGGAFPVYPTFYNSELYFSAMDADCGRELFKMDALGNVSRLTDIATGALSSDPNNLTNLTNQNCFVEYNGSFYFAATDNSGDIELYSYNIQSGAAGRIADINPNGSSKPQYLSVVGTKLLFSADDGTHGREPWALDFSSVGPGLKLSADDLNLQPLFRIYPNPASEYILINADLGSPAEVSIKLLNTIGDEVFSITKSSANSLNEQINISKLASGMYILNIQYGSQTVQRKIIKK